MKNFNSSRSYRPQVWQRCLLMLVMMLTFGVAAFAQSYTYTISKVDVICGNDAGSVTLTIKNTAGTTINGSAQIRKTGDPNHIVNTGTGTLNDDGNFTAGEGNTWSKTWAGVPAGSYDVYFQHDGARDKAGTVTVVNVTENYKSPTLTSKIQAPYCSPSGGANGKVTVTVKDGVGPFYYTAEIKRAAGGNSETLTSGGSISERTWTVEGLAQGDVVKISVADTQNGVCPETSSAAQVEVTMTKENNPRVGYNGVGLYREVLDGTGCNINDYVSLFIDRGTEEARKAQKELLISTLQMYRWSSSKISDMEYVEDKSYTASDGTEYLVFKLPKGVNASSNAYLQLKYKDLCSGEEIFINNSNNPFTFVSKFGEKSNSMWNGETMKLNPVAEQTFDAECNQLTKNYRIDYWVTMNDSKWGQGFTQYYFPEGTKATVEQKQPDGSWKDLNIDVPLDGISLFGRQRTVRTIDLNKYGDGTYRVVYKSDCSIINLSKEVTLKATGAPQLKSNTLVPLCFYGIHGNTAGTVIDLLNSPEKVNVTIEKADGSKSTTFMATEFLSDKEYQFTMNFPIHIEGYQPVINANSKEGRITIGDLPVGKYKIYVDKCGQMSEPATLEIKDTDLRRYKPSNENGYKNGIRVDMGCDNDHQVSFDFGISACTPEYWYDPTNLISWNYWEKTDESSSHSVHGGYKDKEPITGIWSQEGWQVSIGFWKRANVLYSAMANAYVPGDGPSLSEESFSNKIFTIDFAPTEGKGAFEFQAAMCDDKNPTSGMISVGIKEGFNATYPLHYEIRKATWNNGIVTPDATVLASKDITGSASSKHIFTGLEAGWYQVTAAYNYGTVSGCPVQKKNVYVGSVGIPDVKAEWIEKCYGQGLAPNHMEIPVSTYMYDVKWYLDDQEVGVGNTYDAVFTQPGTYTYKVKTWFAEGTSCSGSSGGERKVIITVGDCSGPMEKNLWVGNEDTKFENKNNWTVKVPGDGEDVVFATESNNANPKNPAQKGAAKNDCVLPEGKVLTIGTLENQSDKALVVSKKSSVVVSTALVGYNQPGDAKKLVIKTDEKGTDAGGSFAVSYADPCKSEVYATVELYGRGQKLGNEMLKIEDKLDGSPTKGRTLQAEPYTWQQIGIPVTDMAPSPVFKGSYLQYYSEAKNSTKQYYQKWSWMAKDNTMSPFVGYQLTQDAPKVYALTGKLNLCDHNLTLTRQAAEVTASKSTNVGEKHWGLGQNIFANSYTAAIDIAQLSFPNEVDPTVYVYHTGSFNDWYGNKSETGSKNLSVAAGGYLAVPKDAAATIGYKSIPSMQGFLLKFTKEETKLGNEATVTVHYNSVVKNERVAMAKPFEVTTTEPGAVQMVLESSKGSDVVWLIEAEGTTDGYDRGWDGRKLLTNAPASLYVQTVDGQMQVNTTADLTQQQVTVEGSDSELYTLTIRKKNLPQYEHLKLVDYTTRQLVDLREDVTSYTYTMRHTGVDSNRFKLVNTTATSFGNLPTEIQGVTTATWNGSAVVYTVSGERVANVRQPEDLNRLKAQLPNGVYIVSMQVDGKTVSQKMVITK